MHILGVDIGGTSIKAGVFAGGDSRPVAECSVPTPQSGADGARPVAEAVAIIARELRAPYPDLERIGIGVPGAMTLDRELVRYPPNLTGWREEPLRRYVAEALPEFTRVEVDNDAKVATLAEARLGAGRGESHFMLVTLGTGVGGGLWASEYAGSGIYRGASGGAGEFGHLSIDRNGPRCLCGSTGCIEAYLGQHYLTERTRQRIVGDPDLRTTLRKELAELSPKTIAAAMLAGDTFAREVFTEAGELLGLAMASAAKLLDLHLFIVGGGVAGAGDVLFEAARRTLRENVFENLRPVVEIREAAFGNRAGIIGAAALVSES